LASGLETETRTFGLEKMNLSAPLESRDIGLEITTLGSSGLRGDDVHVERDNRSVKLIAGNEAYLHFYLPNFTDTRSLTAAIRLIPFCGRSTNLTGGLRLTRTEIFNAANGDRSGVPNVIVLITDSNPTREVEILASEVRLIKRLGIRIIVVGVTHAVSENAIIIHLLYRATLTLCYSGICCRRVFVRPSVCPSQASIVSRRLNVGSDRHQCVYMYT